MGNGHSRSARSRAASSTANDAANADGLPPTPPAPARNGTLRHMRSLYTLRRSRRRNTAASAPAAAGDAGSSSARESGDSRAGPAWVATGVENADPEIDHTATLPYPPPLHAMQYGGPPLPAPPEPPLPPPIAASAPPEPLDRAERVNGGHIAPMNDLYHDVHHYDPYLVREFIRARRLAPFYAGLEDVDEDEIQAIAALRGDQGGDEDEEVQDMEGVEKVEEDSAAEVKAWMATVGGAVECPICFLFYPSNINKSICCDQPICTECFVQIKRPDADHPADCPYCVHPGFAVVYAPPAPPRHDPTPDPTPVPTRTATPSPESVPPLPSLPPIAIPTTTDVLAAWPLTADPDPDDLLTPSRLTDSPRATPLSTSAPASAALHAAESVRHASTLTVTATTYTRAPRSRAASTAALPDPEPTADDAPAAANVEPASSAPVSSDDIRPAYVAHLIHEQQLAAWREEQDAQTAHLRRILYAQAAAAAAAAQAAAQAHHDDEDDSDDDRPLRRAYSERARAHRASEQRYVPRRPQAPMPMSWVPGSAEMPMPPLVDLAGEGLPPVEGRHRHRHHRGHRPHLHHSASVSHVPDLEALLVAEAVRESLREVAMGGGGAAAGPSLVAVPPAAEAAGAPTAAGTHDADDDVPIATLLATTLGRASVSAPAVPPRDARPAHAPSPPEPVVPDPVPTANQLRAAPVERPRPVSVAHSESARPKSAHLGDDDVLMMDRMGGVALTSA
ncbi:SNF1-interacting protein [Allomyces javanicus]|nr:SNF1-interacting protein [Allomyces javanicus]